MMAKGEASVLLHNFVAMVKTQFGKDVKIIRCDNGQEFSSRPRNSFTHKKVFYINHVTYTFPNKMEGLRDNIPS